MKKPPLFKFRLYIAGNGPNSVQAAANLRAICAEHLLDGYEIEVVDVLLEERRALDDGVLLTPLLVKLSPAPVRRIAGTLSQMKTVLQSLGVSLPAV